MTKTKKLVVILTVAALLVGAVIYFVVDPSSSTILPKCAFLKLTGFQCPGCGSQRAIHALLHGDVVEAWKFNAMLVVMIPVVAAIVSSSFLKMRYPKFYDAMHSPLFATGLLVAVLLWWLLRNVFGWYQ